MSKWDLTFEGADRLQEKLAAAIPALKENIKAKMNELGSDILDESADIVPMDTGNLASSGHMGRRSEGGGVDEGFAYEEDGMIMLDIGYGGPAAEYALYVHEGLESAGKSIQWTRPGSGPKYLERPFDANKGRLPGMIKEAVDETFNK